MNPQILASILKWLANFLGKSDSGNNVVSATPDPVPAPKPAQPAVDWNNPACKISKHFTVKESTFLNSWQVSHVPSDVQKQAILGIAASMDKVADLLGKALGKPVSMNVHAWIRPDSANCPGSQWDGKDYNRYIYETQVWKDLTSAQKAEKHVPLSPHRTGHAVDFHISGYEGPEGCAKIRVLILPHLEELGLRMEDITGGWVHLDDLPVLHERFFKP